MLIRFQIEKRERIYSAALFRESSKSYVYVLNIIEVRPEFSSFLSNLNNKKTSIDLVNINFKDKKVYMGRLGRSRVSDDVFSFVFRPNSNTYIQKLSNDISFFRFGLGKYSFESNMSNFDELFIKSIAILSNKFKEINNLE